MAGGRYAEKGLSSVMSKFLSKLISNPGNGPKLVYFNSLYIKGYRCNNLDEQTVYM